MKKIMKITGYTLSLVILMLGIWHLTSAQSLVAEQDIPSTFNGNFLAISDADMIATAYATGVSNKIKGIEDSLLHIELSNGKITVNSKIHATNSVISWPAILEWHPTKPYAYVAETRGKIAPENNKMKQVFLEYPSGEKISIIDYSDKNNPKLLQSKSVGENLQNVTINAAGNLLAAGTTADKKELMIATVNKGLIDNVFYFSDDEINYEDWRDGGFRSVEFHPTENIIAANLNGKQVAFYKINQNEGQVTIQKIGKSLEVGRKLSVGNWHPSGNYFLVSDVGWGSGQLGFAFNKKGHLSSLKFDKNGNHSIISQVKVGLSPEGFDISPNGEYAVTVNMRRTYLPKHFGFLPARKKSSLSLIKIAPETGNLEVIGKEYGFKGALPEDAVFDEKGNSLAVAIYHEQDAQFPKQGWIDFWEIQNDRLVKTKTKLYITRGVHNLLLIP